MLSFPHGPQAGHQAGEEVVMVTWEDLKCGKAVRVFGRPLLLLGCDDQTAAWYAARGITQVK